MRDATSCKCWGVLSVERWTPTQADYDGMDVSELTTEDALRDATFGKTQWDIVKFCAIDDAVMRTIPEFTDDELIVFMRYMADFYVNGAFPDYSSITSTAVRMALRANIDGHMARINKALLDSYKSYVKGKRTKKRR